MSINVVDAEDNGKRRSRHAAHAAQALRWKIEQLPKCLI